MLATNVACMGKHINGETFVTAKMCRQQCVPQQCVGNSVSATMCPRLPGPLGGGQILPFLINLEDAIDIHCELLPQKIFCCKRTVRNVK